MGQELGLRLLEDRKSKDSLLINCLNEEVHTQALELEGLDLEGLELVESWASCQSSRSGQSL